MTRFLLRRRAIKFITEKFLTEKDNKIVVVQAKPRRAERAQEIDYREGLVTETNDKSVVVQAKRHRAERAQQVSPMGIPKQYGE